MSSGDFIEGNCQECGNYTKGSMYKWDGLCLSCRNKLAKTPYDYDVAMEEDTCYKPLNSNNVYCSSPETGKFKYNAKKIKENEQYLLDRIKSLYHNYNEFKEIKFMLNVIGYEIETYPELRIWKEV